MYNINDKNKRRIIFLAWNVGFALIPSMRMLAFFYFRNLSQPVGV